MNLKRKLLVTGASIVFSGILAFANPTEASASENTWTARTVEEIKQDIKANDKGSKYTFVWGDTLSAIAAATEISLNTLVEVNNIANADMIIVGNSIFLSESDDHKVVTVGEGEEAKSYDVSNEEEVVEVETPVETIEEYNVIEEEKVVEQAKPAEPAAPAQTASSSEGYTINVEATAYSTNQADLSDYTYTGINLRVNPMVVAVDPNVIPLGSTIIVPGYGTYIAGDTGGAIKGNRIDVHITNLDAAWAFGRQQMTITVIPPK